MQYNISSKDIRNLIVNKLSHNFGVSPKESTNEQYYKALALIINDILFERRTQFTKEAVKQNKKQVYYLCMEFLLGRSLKENLFNLGIESEVKNALCDLDINLDKVYDSEPDPGLGNGGLGRLAACFLNSLSTLGYSAMGYSLRYEYGIFSQKLVDGWQTECPDFWLPGGEVWLRANPDLSQTILFDGEIEESWSENHHSVNYVNARRVIAVPYDIIVSGYRQNSCSKLRLWSAKSADFDMSLFNTGAYAKAMEQSAMAEVITKVLYPKDNHPEGKSLRLSQQYFLVSATIQDIIFRHLRKYNTLDNMPDLVAIHLNDTHPVLAIPEMMRVILDSCGYSWEDAWSIVTQCITYTNHTVMSEALECWSEELLKRRLPRIYQIIFEINRRFCAEMHSIGIDPYQVGRMAVINDGLIKMANLAVAASKYVNGVSKLHSNILKKSIFKDFYQAMPYKFKNVTNGIAYRRWLNQSNPKLADFIENLIGDGFKNDASELTKLLDYKDDPNILLELFNIKHYNKERLAKFIKDKNGIVVDPFSIFDVQIKRLHEYKRQHLNALQILASYHYLKENPNANFIPKTYIFGAKAAPGYYFAKEIIRFIVKLAETINNDKSINDKLKVVFMEDYNVSLAEKIIPAAELSEQISLAGTEASGTSNMKLMINGALTIGTLDGSNVEICEMVGKENMFLFGLTSTEVATLKQSGYNPSTYYNNNYKIKAVVDELSKGFGGIKFDQIHNSLISSDPYMVLADFADYLHAQKQSSKTYQDKLLWNKMSLINIANSGVFSADRAISEYAKSIWDCDPVEFLDLNQK